MLAAHGPNTALCSKHFLSSIVRGARSFILLWPNIELLAHRDLSVLAFVVEMLEVVILAWRRGLHLDYIFNCFTLFLGQLPLDPGAPLGHSC